MDNHSKLAKVFIQSLGLPPNFDVSGLEYSKHKNWDSVAHMQLVAAIERDFEVMLETDDVIGMSSFEVAQEILKKHGVAF